ncbi:MAG TPA: glycosyltransferase [Candidatus Acidoferrum sp.]|nr:glycosyltransferase [Candidatus Acidoferrum sp.]
MTRPFVSVLIDTYNHERFIEQAIVSVLEQDFPAEDREILVVDDGSTDRTPEIVRKFEPRVRLIRKENGGQASAFNAGIPECEGEIVAFLDGDDWWVREKLRIVSEAFRENPGVGSVGHGCRMVDVAGNLQSLVTAEKAYKFDARNEEGARLFSQLRCFLGASKVAYRTFITKQILPVPEGAVIEADEYLFTVAACLMDLFILEQPLFNYRLHENNLYMLQNRNERALLRKYESLCCLLKSLPPKMDSLGISAEVKRIMLEPLAVEVQSHRLQIEGGSRWEMFQSERSGAELAYSHTPFGYKLFKYFAMAIALTLPPRYFLLLKEWYAAKDLRRIRKWFGDPVPAAPIIERRIKG